MKNPTESLERQASWLYLNFTRPTITIPANCGIEAMQFEITWTSHEAKDAYEYILKLLTEYREKEIIKRHDSGGGASVKEYAQVPFR